MNSQTKSHQQSTPELTIQRLKASGIRLGLFIESSELAVADRDSLFSTIGEIAYVADGLSLATSARDEIPKADFENLMEHSNRLCDLVNEVVTRQ